MCKETDKYKFCNHHHELTEDQEIINLGTGDFVADKKMIPLLKELNKAGLITRSHCGGHGTGKSFVVIKTDNIFHLEIRNYHDMKEVVISWEKKC
jgi:hypothetical protein